MYSSKEKGELKHFLFFSDKVKKERKKKNASKQESPAGRKTAKSEEPGGSLSEGNQLAGQDNLARGAGDADTQANKEQAEKRKHNNETGGTHPQDSFSDFRMKPDWTNNQTVGP